MRSILTAVAYLLLLSWSVAIASDRQFIDQCMTITQLPDISITALEPDCVTRGPTGNGCFDVRHQAMVTNTCSGVSLRIGVSTGRKESELYLSPGANEQVGCDQLHDKCSGLSISLITTHSEDTSSTAAGSKSSSHNASAANGEDNHPAPPGSIAGDMAALDTVMKSNTCPADRTPKEQLDLVNICGASWDANSDEDKRHTCYGAYAPLDSKIREYNNFLKSCVPGSSGSDDDLDAALKRRHEKNQSQQSLEASKKAMDADFAGRQKRLATSRAADAAQKKQDEIASFERLRNQQQQEEIQQEEQAKQQAPASPAATASSGPYDWIPREYCPSVLAIIRRNILGLDGSQPDCYYCRPPASYDAPGTLHGDCSTEEGSRQAVAACSAEYLYPKDLRSSGQCQ